MNSTYFKTGIYTVQADLWTNVTDTALSVGFVPGRPVTLGDPSTYYTTDRLTRLKFVAYRFSGILPATAPAPAPATKAAALPVVRAVPRPVGPVFRGQSVGLLKLGNDTRMP